MQLCKSMQRKALTKGSRATLKKKNWSCYSFKMSPIFPFLSIPSFNICQIPTCPRYHPGYGKCRDERHKPRLLMNTFYSRKCRRQEHQQPNHTTQKCTQCRGGTQEEDELRPGRVGRRPSTGDVWAENQQVIMKAGLRRLRYQRSKTFQPRKSTAFSEIINISSRLGWFRGSGKKWSQEGRLKLRRQKEASSSRAWCDKLRKSLNFSRKPSFSNLLVVTFLAPSPVPDTQWRLQNRDGEKEREHLTDYKKPLKGPH